MKSLEKTAKRSPRTKALRAAQVVTLGLALAGGGGCYGSQQADRGGYDPDMTPSTARAEGNEKGDVYGDESYSEGVDTNDPVMLATDGAVGSPTEPDAGMAADAEVMADAMADNECPTEYPREGCCGWSWGQNPGEAAQACCDVVTDSWLDEPIVIGTESWQVYCTPWGPYVPPSEDASILGTGPEVLV